MKKRQQIKRARKLVKGLILKWSDDDAMSPTPHINDSEVTHRSPVLRLQSRRVWSDYKDWIYDAPALLWRIEINAVFLYPNGLEQHEERMVVHRGSLRDIASSCDKHIQDAHRAGAKEHYVETRFVCECLGDRPKDSDDFEFSEIA